MLKHFRCLAVTLIYVTCYSYQVHETKDTGEVYFLTKGTCNVNHEFKKLVKGGWYGLELEWNDFAECLAMNFACFFCVKLPGDNNEYDDIPLYAENQLWLQRQHLMGKAIG